MFSPEQYRALHHAAGLVDRSSRGRLRLTGADRRDYLQGLLSNDIVALQPGTGCYATLLTAQGRMIADMNVVETGDCLLVDLEADVAAKVAGHFDQFIFSEDVQVADESAVLAQLGVFGPRAASSVSRALAAGGASIAPEALDGMAVLDNRTITWGGAQAVLIRRDDTGVAGFDVVIDRSKADALRQALLDAGATSVDPETVDVTRIEAGRPIFHQDMDEDTIPLEAGIEDRAISLTKGCYVGQEIIIRVLHRGQGRVARRLVGLTLEPSAAVPTPGDKLRAGEREVGRVTSAAWSPALQRPIALGYVHRDLAAPGGTVTIATDGSPSATVSALPFAASNAAPDYSSPATSA